MKWFNQASLPEKLYIHTYAISDARKTDLNSRACWKRIFYKLCQFYFLPFRFISRYFPANPKKNSIPLQRLFTIINKSLYKWIPIVTVWFSFAKKKTTLKRCIITKWAVILITIYVYLYGRIYPKWDCFPRRWK